MRYSKNKSARISFPLGGIGTGCIGLGGNGALKDWEIFNRPNKNSLNGFTHFAIRAEVDKEVVDARVLQSDCLPPFDTTFYGAPRETLAGLPHFKNAVFTGEYPIGKIDFEDPAFPGKVSLTAFNPFIPHNDKDSSIPAAFFEFEIHNVSRKTIRYTLAGSLANPVFGRQTHRAFQKGALSSIHLTGDGVAEKLPAEAVRQGDLCIATDAKSTSWQEFWFNGGWFDSLEIYWKDLCRGGKFKNRTYPLEEAVGVPSNGFGLVQTNHALLAAHVVVPAGKRERVRFIISWNFALFEKYWGAAAADGSRPSWRNYYATQWKDSSASATYGPKNWGELWQKTVQFRDLLFSSSLPAAAIDAVSANLSILKSPTVLRLTDGTFWAWEGCQEKSGSCEGTCTHVWNYGQALPFLFPALERSVREADYKYNQQENGGMPFRLLLPLGTHNRVGRSAADGLFSSVLTVYRDWKLSGDRAWLREIWPAVKKSIAFAWADSNVDQWDPKKSGILWGRQHHTLDIEMFGPNAWLSGLYLAALKAAAEMASFLQDTEAVVEYTAIFERGRSWLNTHLFNGRYFHQIIELKDKDLVSRFGAAPYYWNGEHGEIKYQIGEGCGIDQILGQWHADLYGLGEIFEPAKVQAALGSIYRYNFYKKMRDVFNACRLYALNDEGGAVICTWPQGSRRPAIPVTYAQETMHGFEYAAASHMIRRGMVRQGMDLVKSIRDRYDGAKRNPWGELECGYNYGRSTASYALLLAFSGFSFDMSSARMGFAPVGSKQRRMQFFWSTGKAWGAVTLTAKEVILQVESGILSLLQLDLPMLAKSKQLKITLQGKQIAGKRVKDGVCLLKKIRISSGEQLHIKV